MDRSHSLRVAYLVFAWGIVVALLVQVSLIGLWLFAGRLPGIMKWITTLLSAILVVQTEIFAIIPGSPLRAFHPVLPLVIFSLAAFLAYSAIPLVKGRPRGSALPLSVAESRAN